MARKAAPLYLRLMLKRYSTLLLAAAAIMALSAAEFSKSTYYAAANGKKGRALKTALCGIIVGHTARSYDNLWTDFRSTDMRADGKVWDIYSSTTNYTFGADQAGSYKKEGDVYNREHSFPKSWFDDRKPMYTDLYHLYPSDGYVNNRRGNHCFGEVGSVTYSSEGGFCLLGSPTDELRSQGCRESLVFEPNDIFKGDLARTYFYMVTAYESQLSTWPGSGMLSGDAYPSFISWASALLLKWSKQDSVSAKETNRIEAVYAIQKNRNPFIDFPGLEEYIWGTWADSVFSVMAYRNPYTYAGGGTTEPDEPIVEPDPNPDDPIVIPDPVDPAEGDNYVLLTTTPEVWTGQYLIAYHEEDEAYLLNGSLNALDASTNYVKATPVDGVIVATPEVDAAAFRIEEAEGGYSLRSLSTQNYVGSTASKNAIYTSEVYSAAYANRLSVSGGQAVITGKSGYALQFNVGGDRFRYYTSGGQKPVALYRLEVKTGLSALPAVESDAPVYDLQGRRMPVGSSLCPGIYIRNGRKFHQK